MVVKSSIIFEVYRSFVPPHQPRICPSSPPQPVEPAERGRRSHQKSNDVIAGATKSGGRAPIDGFCPSFELLAKVGMVIYIRVLKMLIITTTGVSFFFSRRRKSESKTGEATIPFHPVTLKAAAHFFLDLSRCWE